MNINGQNMLNYLLYNNLIKNVDDTSDTFTNNILDNINQYVLKNVSNTDLSLNYNDEIKLILSSLNQLPTEENIELVKTLIQNSLPINKENVQNMIKATKIFKNNPIEKALFLIENNIKPTLDMCKQVESYISKDISIDKQIENLFININKLEDSPSILKNMFNNTTIENLISNTNNILKDIKLNLFDSIISNKDTNSTNINLLINTKLEEYQSLQLNNNLNIPNKSTILNTILDFTLSDDIIFNPNKIDILKQMINNNEKFDFNIMDNSPELLKNINNILDNNSILNIQKEIFNIIKSNSEYNFKFQDFFDKFNIIKNKFKHFNIENSSPKELNDFFNDLDTILKNVKDNIYNVKDNNTEILKNIDDLNKNLEFMSNIKNSIFLQIPLNINNFSTTAELFIFSNKKNKNTNKKNTDGSALISLNLTYLGKLEVYINKSNQDISCQFRLEKEETKNSIKNNITLLGNYLKQKNLNLKDISFKNLDENFTLINKNINNIKNNTNIPLSNFNAKA